MLLQPLSEQLVLCISCAVLLHSKLVSASHHCMPYQIVTLLRTYHNSDWNPQNDVQAMARCHRIGQTKSVRVYRLITRGSFEAEMFARASRKLGLEQAVLGNPGQVCCAQILYLTHYHTLLFTLHYCILRASLFAGTLFVVGCVHHVYAPSPMDTVLKLLPVISALDASGCH
jgi:hypothetical protein